MKNSVVITGGSGGLGTGLKRFFYDKGWHVISIDKISDNSFCDEMLCYDLAEVVNDEKVAGRLQSEIETISQKVAIKGLIHNGAVQITAAIEELTILDMQHSFDVNVLSGFQLSKMLKNTLSENNGSIVLVGSVHATQTKRNFAAYSISKTALLGLTKSLAIEFGQNVAVNSVEPAAIDTQMLREGFDHDKNRMASLANYHPTKSIAAITEISELVYFLIDNKILFLNGANIEIDGGISKLLNDPEC